MTHSALLDALVGDDTIAGWFDAAAELRAMLAFEAALAEAQAACGLVPSAAATAIAEACARFTPDWPRLRAGMAVDGVPGPALVAALRATLEPAHRGWLHHRATSQDLVDTALTLRLRHVLAELAARLQGVLAQLEALRAAQGEVAQMAHTRMQRALTLTAGDRIDAWTRPLLRHRQSLAELSPRLLAVQFGGPVGIRDGLDGRGDEVAAALAARLGLGAAPCWHTARDGIVGLGHWLALLTGALGKIGQDVALLAQSEMAAVRLAGGGGSSAMAHKVNPVAAEMLVTLARLAAGQSGTLAQCLVHENERSGAAWTLEWLLLPSLAVSAGAALRHAAGLLDGLCFVPAA